MKLATYKDGSRDGQLVVVSRDLGTAHYATGIASKLQQALDDWGFISPQLPDLYDQPTSGPAPPPLPFFPPPLLSPLTPPPRCTRAAATTSSALATTSWCPAKPWASTSRPRSPSSPAT